MITNQIYNVLFLKTKGFCLPLQWKATVFIDLAVLLFSSVVVVLFLRLITFLLIFLVLKHTLLYLYVPVRHGLYGGEGGGADPAWIERFTLEAESMLVSVYIMRKRLTSSPKPTALTHALIVSLLNRVDPAG